MLIDYFSQERRRERWWKRVRASKDLPYWNETLTWVMLVLLIAALLFVAWIFIFGES